MPWNSLIPRGTDCSLAAVLYTYSLFFSADKKGSVVSAPVTLHERAGDKK